MKITHWIPFAINSQNWEKARPIAEKAISTILKGDELSFKPEMVLDVVGELWKTKAVEMMKGGIEITFVVTCVRGTRV